MPDTHTFRLPGTRSQAFQQMQQMAAQLGARIDGNEAAGRVQGSLFGNSVVMDYEMTETEATVTLIEKPGFIPSAAVWQQIEGALRR